MKAVAIEQNIPISIYIKTLTPAMREAQSRVVDVFGTAEGMS